MNRFFVLATLLSSSAALRAQTAPAIPAAASPIPAAAGSSPSDEVITLNAFDVTSNNKGYLGAETTSGTRYAAPISEIPFNVQIVTSQMIEDYQAFDLAGQSAFQYTGSFSNAFPESSTGVIVVRGVRGFAIFNNGIREGGVYGPASIDRIELVEGESDSIYGQAEPSGAINRVTKEGKNTPFQSASVTVGDNNLSRTLIDVNQPIIPDKLLFRFAASYENSQQFASDFMHFWRQDIYASMTYKFSPTVVFNLHADYVVLDSTSQSAFQMPFVVNPAVVLNGVTTTAVIGQLGQGMWNTKLFNRLNLDGPFSYNKVRYGQIDANLNKTYHDWLSVELLTSYWHRPQENPISKFSGTNAGEYNVATGQIQGTSSMQSQANDQNQWNGQINVLADFKTGFLHNKFLVTSDFVKAEEPFNYAAKSTLASASFPLQNFMVGGPFSSPGFPYGIDFGNTAVWNSVVTNQKSATETKGGMVNYRAGVFDDRFIVSIGVRHDQIDQSLINYLATTNVSSTGAVIPAGQIVDYPEAKAWTYQTGMVFKITPSLVAYADYASDFVPQAANIPVDINHNPISPVTGEGGDVGLKADLFDHKLSFTFAAYDALRKNIAVAALTSTGSAADFPGTTVQYDDVDSARYAGAEVDLTWNPSPNLSVTGGIGYTRGKYVAVANPTQSYLIGLTPDDTPEIAGGVFAKYYFSGRLSGFRATLGWTGQSQELISNSTVSVYGNSNAKGPVLTENGQTFQEYLFRDAGWAIINPGVGYSWESRGYNQSVSINVNNALNKHYFVQTDLMAGISANVTYTIRH